MKSIKMDAEIDTKSKRNRGGPLDVKSYRANYFWVWFGDPFRAKIRKYHLEAHQQNQCKTVLDLKPEGSKIEAKT